MRTLLLTVLFCALAVPASADDRAASAPRDAAAAVPSWSGSLGLYLNLLEDGTTLMPIVAADRGALHLEGRFQYEDLETMSVWAGRTFTAGSDVTIDLVPMVGGIFGRTDGFAPGLELTLTWKDFELYSENEYVFAAGGTESDYFYDWSTLGWYARPELAIGLATQRLRPYGSDRDVSPGAFAALSRGSLELSCFGFDLFDEAPYVVLALGADF